MGENCIALEGCSGSYGDRFGQAGIHSPVPKAYREMPIELKLLRDGVITDVSRGGQEIVINALPEGMTTARYEQLKDTALSYGASRGLRYRYNQINKMLFQYQSYQDEIYRFDAVVLPVKNGTGYLVPPVLVEAKSFVESGQDLIKVTDSYYKMHRQSYLTSGLPNWRSYLHREYINVSPPHAALLPKNSGEKKVWASFIDKGWNKGLEQGTEIFITNNAKLKRDYLGMWTYFALQKNGYITKSVLQHENLGVRKNKAEMFVGGTKTKLVAKPHFVSDTDKWSDHVVTNHTPNLGLENVKVRKTMDEFYNAWGTGIFSDYISYFSTSYDANGQPFHKWRDAEKAKFNKTRNFYMKPQSIKVKTHSDHSALVSVEVLYKLGSQRGLIKGDLILDKNRYGEWKIVKDFTSRSLIGGK